MLVSLISSRSVAAKLVHRRGQNEALIKQLYDECVPLSRSVDASNRGFPADPQALRRDGPIGLQGSLLDLEEELGLRELPGGIRRTQLSHGAWVDLRPGWVTGSERLFDALRRDVDWRGERRRMYERVVDTPRLLRFFGADEALPHPFVDRARLALTAHYAAELGEPFTSVGMCLYRDGRDSVAWHGDTIGRGATCDTMVAIVSLGTPRPLLLRPRRTDAPGTGGGARTSLRFVVGHGDLLVMGGSCQRTWEHAVPKVGTATGPRISLQYRPRGVA